MKKVLLFIFVFLIVFPLSINAQVLRDYNESVAYSRDYINKFPFWTRYLVYNSSDLLSKEEFDVTFINNKSYLVDGKEYWTKTSVNDLSQYYISSMALHKLKTKESVSASTGTFYGYVKDNVGNESKCSIEVKSTSCTPTAWSCASGYAKASDSWCYK